MSLSPNEKYPGATEADPNYKDSKFKDNNPSTTNNGSPLKALDRNEQLALQEAMMNAAGFDYNGVVDTPQNSQMFSAYKAALSNGANLLSNHNFIIASPDDSQPAPSATPTSYPPGYEIFSGVFANETTGILNLTYIDGRVSFSGGDFYMAVPNTGALENITEFVASVADFDGKPRTRGVSYALVGDEYRVTVGVDALEDAGATLTPLGSVKFEQGSVATGHEVSTYNQSSEIKVWLPPYSANPNSSPVDQTTALQKAIDDALLKNIPINFGDYSWDVTNLKIYGRGLTIRQSRFGSITSTTGSGVIVEIGGRNDQEDGQYTNIDTLRVKISLNATSGTVLTDGVAFTGIDDDANFDSSKLGVTRRLHVFGEEAQNFGLRVSSWSHYFAWVEVENSAFVIGAECNSNQFGQVRLTGMNGTALKTEWSGAISPTRSAAIHFSHLTVQQCGEPTGNFPPIALNKGRSIKVDSLYLEDNEGTRDIVCNGAFRGLVVGQLHYAGIASTTKTIIEANDDTFVKVEQWELVSDVGNVLVANGASTNCVVGQGRSSATIHDEILQDNTTSRFTTLLTNDNQGNTFHFLQGKNSAASAALMAKNNATGLESWRCRGDGKHEWPGGYQLDPSASEFSFLLNGLDATITALRLILPSGNRLVQASSSPEGNVTAPPGSICMVNLGSTGYISVKETGTGNTGWVQK